MQTSISCAKVQLKLNFTIKHLLRKGTNDAYNEAKSMQLEPSKFLCIATVDVWHRPTLQHSLLVHSYSWLVLYVWLSNLALILLLLQPWGKDWLGLIHFYIARGPTK